MKILFIHASAGAGHLKAAEALYLTSQTMPGHEAVFVDALDLCSTFYKKSYRKTYAVLISNLPSIWGMAFALLDIPWLQLLIRRFRRLYNWINARKVQEYMQREKFDAIVSTHFMPTEISAALKRKGLIQSKVITVVTDFDVHRIWLAEGVDYYTAASEWTKKKLISLGIPENKIVVTGIPTNEKFSAQPDIAELKRSLGLKEDMFTILMATGSFGIGPIEQIIEALKGFQVIVVCGHNKNLFKRLSRKQYDGVKVCGLVDNMHELMAVSDAMITKPGGLSISEALVSQLPMIFFNAIPGQETNNIKVLREHGIGISDCTIDEMVQEVQKLQSSKDAFLTALKRTKQLARPTAVRDILALLS